MSTHTIWQILREAGFDWQRDRSWCETGKVERKRGGEVVTVIDSDAQAKKVDRARLHRRRELGACDVDRRRGGAIPDGALSQSELAANRRIETQTS